MKTKRAILPLILLSATSASGSGVAAASPGRAPAVAPDAQPKERIALRMALYRAGRQEASKDMGRFRPLCDTDGYPLVGNVAGKDRGYTVVAYCTDVRAAKGSKRS